MVAEDSYLFHSSTEEYFKDLQDPFEAEEALSLCDLPIHSDAFKWDEDYSSAKLDPTSSSDEDDNLFEFFTEDFKPSTFPAKNDIIFCGKLIPYKQFPVPEKTHNFKINQKQNPTKKKSKFQWRSLFFNRLSKPISNSQDKDAKALTLPNSKNEAKKCGISILASPTKSRWYFFMFGIGRFPTDMELKDMKLRQSKKFPSTMFSSYFDNEMDVKESHKQKRRSENGLWRLLKAFIRV